MKTKKEIEKMISWYKGNIKNYLIKRYEFQMKIEALEWVLSDTKQVKKDKKK